MTPARLQPLANSVNCSSHWKRNMRLADMWEQLARDAMWGIQWGEYYGGTTMAKCGETLPPSHCPARWSRQSGRCGPFQRCAGGWQRAHRFRSALLDENATDESFDQRARWSGTTSKKEWGLRIVRLACDLEGDLCWGQRCRPWCREDMCTEVGACDAAAAQLAGTLRLYKVERLEVIKVAVRAAHSPLHDATTLHQVAEARGGLVVKDKR